MGKQYLDAVKALYGDKLIHLSTSRARKKRAPNKKESEHDIQVRVVNWIEFVYPLLRFHSIPNGAHVSPQQRAKLVREGLASGAPDLCIPLMRKGYGGLYIELKRDKESVVSKEQAEWIDYLIKEGYSACVCRGYDEAIEKIKWYLGS